MDLDQIDEQLRRYSAAENRIVANLVELDAHSTYQLLKAGTLTGETEHRLGDHVAAVPRLWDQLTLLQDALARAHAARGTGRRINDDRRQELIRVLVEPSIVLDQATRPLAERELDGRAGAAEHVTIDELLAAMRELYEPLRDGVAAIDAVWRELLPRADSADATLERLRADLEELGVTEPLVSVAERKLAEIRSRALDDPLSLPPDAGPDLDAAVEAAVGQVAHLHEGRATLQDDVAGAEILLATVRGLRARAAAALSETSAKVADAEGLVRVPGVAAIEGAEGLAAGLDEATAPSAPWQQLRQRLDGWLGRARRFEAQLQGALAANRAPLERRDELRGLLKAYRAKAAAMGLAEDETLAEIVDEAHNELYTAPADLERSNELVTELAAALREREGAVG